MDFNIDKCAIMQISTIRGKQDFGYQMKNSLLEKVKHHYYLGVELSDNMKYNLHIDTIFSKAYRLLGFIKRNLRHCPQKVKVKERADQSLVRPRLEYNYMIWKPHQQTQ